MPERRYGQWAGNPKGVPEDAERCIEEVFDFCSLRSCACVSSLESKGQSNE